MDLREGRKYMTGFCSAGHHEGGRYPSFSGKLNKTCQDIDGCGCTDPNCHSFFDKMFEMSGQDRIPVDNSGYAPEKHNFTMPERVIVEAPSIFSSDDVPDTPDALESPAPGVVPPDKRRSFDPTASGRAARGELEAWVKQACDVWVVEQPRDLCTPTWIAEEISKTQGIKAPSTGAITAVLERWVRYGFAVMAKKPTRFCGYTDAAVQYGLEALKEKAKRGEKLQTAAANRGERQ